jgi:hypothetical protein
MAYRTESALPYLYKEKERRDEGMRNLMKMFMMQKQLGAERGEREFERGVEEEEREKKFEHWGVLEDLQRAQTERTLRPDVPAEPRIPAEIQAAEIVSKQTGESLGAILNRWKSRKGAEPKEPGIKKSRQKWIEGLDKSINTMIKGIQNRPEYGMDEELTSEVTNLQQAKTKIRAALLLGADQPLPDTMWRDLGKISESLEQIQKVGLFPPEKKPLVKAKLPRKKRAELPPGTEIKWNPKLNLKMAKIDGVWYWVRD